MEECCSNLGIPFSWQFVALKIFPNFSEADHSLTFHSSPHEDFLSAKFRANSPRRAHNSLSRASPFKCRRHDQISLHRHIILSLIKAKVTMRNLFACQFSSPIGKYLQNYNNSPRSANVIEVREKRAFGRAELMPSQFHFRPMIFALVKCFLPESTRLTCAPLWSKQK